MRVRFTVDSTGSYTRSTDYIGDLDLNELLGSLPFLITKEELVNAIESKDCEIMEYIKEYLLDTEYAFEIRNEDTVHTCETSDVVDSVSIYK